MQAATILEAGIRAAEHLEADTPHQGSCALKTREALLKQMISSDVISGDIKGKFQKLEGATDSVLGGEAILKRLKLLRRKMVSTPLGTQLLDGLPFQRREVSIDLDICPNLRGRNRWSRCNLQNHSGNMTSALCPVQARCGGVR